MRSLRWVMVLALPLSACTSVEESAKKTDCNDDEKLCPSSVKTATRVACSCKCQLPHIPLPGFDTPKYKGKLLACLPPSLNPMTGSTAEQLALTQMPQPRYNQQIFKFCSEDVADWLSLTIKSQLAGLEQVPTGLTCQPYECRCDTDGAQLDDLSCETPCDEEECDKESCEPILRQGGILELRTCSCTRTRACGFVSPSTEKPGLCRPFTAELHPTAHVSSVGARSVVSSGSTPPLSSAKR
jgi:hypothetical protein